MFKLDSNLADEVINLSFSCAGLGLSLAAVAGTGGAAAIVGGAAAATVGLRHLAAQARAAPDSPRQMDRIRKTLLGDQEWSEARHFADRQALERCQAALREALPLCSVSPKELADIARAGDFAEGAADYVLGKVARQDRIFAGGVEADFARAVIREGFRAAILDEAYFRGLEPHLLLSIAHDVARGREAAECGANAAQANTAKLDAQGLPFTPDLFDQLREIAESDSPDPEQVVASLREKIERLIRIAEQAEGSSGPGDVVNRLRREVAAATAQSPEAGHRTAEAGLAAIRQRQTVELRAALELAIDAAMVAGDIDAAATHAWELADLAGEAAPEFAYRYAAAQYEQGLRFGSPDALQLAARICEIHRGQKNNITVEWQFLNLQGNALSTRGQRGDEAALDGAIAAYKEALTIYTVEQHPHHHKIASQNLAKARELRGSR